MTTAHASASTAAPAETERDLLNRVGEHFRAGDLRAAEDACRTLLRSRPDHARALTWAALIDLAEGHVAVAEATLREAVSIAPELADARRHLESVRGNLRGVAAHPYVRTYLRRRRVYMDCPKDVAIELTARCNGRCSFCPHGALDRRGQDMSDELFDKIVRDLGEIPRELPFNIFPSVIGEPLLDPKLFGRLRRINRELPQATLYLYTNLHAPPEGFFDDIRRVRRLAYVNISLNAANADEYRRMTGLDFDRTVENVRRLLAEQRRRPFLPTPPELSRVADGTDRDAAFVAECKRLFADFQPARDYEVRLKGRADWLGRAGTRVGAVPSPFPCVQWLHLTVLCEGTVALCCMDAAGEHAIGDARTDSLMEIYNAPRFRGLRAAVTARELAYPCSTCTLL